MYLPISIILQTGGFTFGAISIKSRPSSFAFLIASFVYLSTIEQTVSFWDCGEYISTAYKLEVGHPPGAPLYQMLGAVFSLFATSPEKIALAVNYLSVVSSAFVILFLFWSITLLLRKIYDINHKINS